MDSKNASDYAIHMGGIIDLARDLTQRRKQDDKAFPQLKERDQNDRQGRPRDPPARKAGRLSLSRALSGL